MKPLAAASNDPSRDWLNLQPIVDTLTAHGNSVVGRGFELTRDGFVCKLRGAIDFDLLEQEFDFPPSIKYSRETDEILDTKTWNAIAGGNSARLAGLA